MLRMQVIYHPYVTDSTYWTQQTCLKHAIFTL